MPFFLQNSKFNFKKSIFKLNLHFTILQVSVNEAAAQICKHVPALLTRRDELFPLARQVVRDSGYQYSKGHSRYLNQAKKLQKNFYLLLVLFLYQENYLLFKKQTPPLHFLYKHIIYIVQMFQVTILFTFS